jgi:hypothetical protein
MRQSMWGAKIWVAPPSGGAMSGSKRTYGEINQTGNCPDRDAKQR